ncbi:hypothetical protein LCGC14_2380010 [marine sediment metagenome]|uniref:Uncharacterized protein n=1 Tax=marine sediment metagenome TaxID=412755 RepID=A0A0F9EVZ3_9ZZZZ
MVNCYYITGESIDAGVYKPGKTFQRRTYDRVRKYNEGPHTNPVLVLNEYHFSSVRAVEILENHIKSYFLKNRRPAKAPNTGKKEVMDIKYDILIAEVEKYINDNLSKELTRKQQHESIQFGNLFEN